MDFDTFARRIWQATAAYAVATVVGYLLFISLPAIVFSGRFHILRAVAAGWVLLGITLLACNVLSLWTFVDDPEPGCNQ